MTEWFIMESATFVAPQDGVIFIEVTAEGRRVNITERSYYVQEVHGLHEQNKPTQQ